MRSRLGRREEVGERRKCGQAAFLRLLSDSVMSAMISRHIPGCVQVRVVLCFVGHSSCIHYRP